MEVDKQTVLGGLHLKGGQHPVGGSTIGLAGQHTAAGGGAVLDLEAHSVLSDLDVEGHDVGLTGNHVDGGLRHHAAPGAVALQVGAVSTAVLSGGGGGGAVVGSPLIQTTHFEVTVVDVAVEGGGQILGQADIVDQDDAGIGGLSGQLNHDAADTIAIGILHLDGHLVIHPVAGSIVHPGVVGHVGHLRLGAVVGSLSNLHVEDTAAGHALAAPGQGVGFESLHSDVLTGSLTPSGGVVQLDGAAGVAAGHDGGGRALAPAVGAVLEVTVDHQIVAGGGSLGHFLDLLLDDQIIDVQIHGYAGILEFKQDATLGEGDGAGGHLVDNVRPRGSHVKTAGNVPVGTPVAVLDGDTHVAGHAGLSLEGDHVILGGIHVLDSSVGSTPATGSSPLHTVAAVGTLSNDAGAGKSAAAIIEVQAQVGLSRRNAHRTHRNDGAQHQQGNHQSQCLTQVDTHSIFLLESKKIGCVREAMRERDVPPM